MFRNFFHCSPKPVKTRKLILVLPGVGNIFKRILLRIFMGSPGSFALFILPALTPSHFSVKILGQKVFWFNRDFESGALVGISSVTSSVIEGYKIADRFRKAGSVVVMGGIHASCMPEEALEHADAIVIGEAESVWPEVVRDYENGTLKKIYRGQPLDDYFAPCYSYFQKINPKILRQTGLILSRGCKYQCEFCVLHEKKLRFIKFEHAVELIQRMARAGWRPFGGRPSIQFLDGNIYSDPVRARNLFRAMIPMKVRWDASSSIDIAFDEEALRLAKESGCRSLFIGFESIYPQTLPKTSVGQMTKADDYIRAIKKLRAYKIKVIGAFIIGLDDCTHTYYFRLIWFLFRARLYIVALSILTPFPGSQLYERLKTENRIITSDWQKYDGMFRVVFRPRHMSVPALYSWFIVVRLFGLLASSIFQNVLLILFIPYFFVLPWLRDVLSRYPLAWYYPFFYF